MVRVVDKSQYGYGYYENNQQLAKELSEVRQQLGSAFQEIQKLRKEVHRCHVQIVDYKRKENETAPILAKYDAIKNIISDKQPRLESIQGRINHQTTSIQALTESRCDTRNSPLRLPSISHNNSSEEEEDDEEDGDEDEGTLEDDENELEHHSRSPLSEHGSASTRTANESHDDDDDAIEDEEEELTIGRDGANSSYEEDNSRRVTTNVLHPILEGSDEEDIDDHDCHNSTKQSSLPSPSPQRTITPVDDSLVPADVTSVPSINHQPERTIHTPSIWNCLDPLESDTDSQQKQPHQEQEQASQQRLTYSPARSAGSSASGGLRISQNINSSSPIHPITRKANPNLNEDMFHSTPVQAQKSKAISSLLNKKSISDPKLSSFNQENCDAPVRAQAQAAVVADDENVANQKKAKKPTKRAPVKSKQPVRRAVKFTMEDENGVDEEPMTHVNELVHEPPAPPTRYNLRKRAKV